MTKDAILQAGRRVIGEEADALGTLATGLGESFVDTINALMACKGRILVTGMGKSGHIARKIAATLASTGSPATYIHPGEASHGDLGMVGKDDIIIALSRSGETSELGDLLAHARSLGLILVGITGVTSSTLATTAQHALILPARNEACGATNAPTTSTTMMLALGDAIAVALLEGKGFTAEDFKRFHPGGQLGAALRTVGELMRTGDKIPLVPAGSSVTEALNKMTSCELGCVGVVDTKSALTGILTDGDVRRIIVEDKRGQTIDEVMTRTPITLSADMRAAKALGLMNERRITQAFVLSDERPVGIVHMHDFLRAGIS